jgi:hypothetical protein
MDVGIFFIGFRNDSEGRDKYVQNLYLFLYFFKNKSRKFPEIDLWLKYVEIE